MMRCAGPYRCYEHDKDVVIPSFYLKDAKPVSPFDAPRTISLLIRFSGTLQFHDHIRQRLLNYWQVSNGCAPDCLVKPQGSATEGLKPGGNWGRHVRPYCLIQG